MLIPYFFIMHCQASSDHIYARAGLNKAVTLYIRTVRSGMTFGEGAHGSDEKLSDAFGEGAYGSAEKLSDAAIESAIDGKETCGPDDENAPVLQG